MREADCSLAILLQCVLGALTQRCPSAPILCVTLAVQASLSVAVLFASFIAQQRLRPFVSAATLSSGLQVGSGERVAWSHVMPLLTHERTWEAVAMVR
jgi:hypothetical protein